MCTYSFMVINLQDKWAPAQISQTPSLPGQTDSQVADRGAYPTLLPFPYPYISEIPKTRESNLLI